MNAKKLALISALSIGCSTKPVEQYGFERAELLKTDTLNRACFYDVFSENEKADGKVDIACFFFKEQNKEKCYLIIDEKERQGLQVNCTYTKDCTYKDISRDSKTAKIIQKIYDERPKQVP